MAYKVQITPRIRALLSNILGQSFDETKFSVYESVAFDNTAITGAGGIFKNATMSDTFLSQATNTAKNSYVPMIELHDEYNKLPVGRVIDAGLFDSEQGTKDLHVLFYIPSSTDPESLDFKINTGIISSLSGGFSPSKISCSTCGFDLNASDEVFEKFYWTETCGNGHVLNQDMHVVMNELKTWDELSFVTQGAVPRAKILSTDKQKLANKNELLGLAASKNIDKLRFNTTPNLKNPDQVPNKGNNMSKIEIEMTEYKGYVQLEAQRDHLSVELNNIKEQKVNLEKAKTDLELEKVNLEKAKADLEAEKTQLAQEKTDLEAEKVNLTAENTSLKAQLATAGIPVGGKSNPANAASDSELDDVTLYKRQ